MKGCRVFLAFFVAMLFVFLLMGSSTTRVNEQYRPRVTEPAGVELPSVPQAVSPPPADPASPPATKVARSPTRRSEVGDQEPAAQTGGSNKAIWLYGNHVRIVVPDTPNGKKLDLKSIKCIPTPVVGSLGVRCSAGVDTVKVQLHPTLVAAGVKAVETSPDGGGAMAYIGKGLRYRPATW